MSREHRVQWGCLRKVRYPFHWNAVVVCVRAYREREKRLYPYPCKYCHFWHVASADKQEEQVDTLSRLDDGTDPWAVTTNTPFCLLAEDAK